MAELVQGPAPARFLEDLGCPAIGKTIPPTSGVEVGARQGEPGPALGKEQRAGPSSLEEPGKQPGCARLPHDDVGGATSRRTLAWWMARFRSSTSRERTSLIRAAVS